MHRQHEEELREAERRGVHAKAESRDAAAAKRAAQVSEQRARSEAERLHAIVARQEAAAREAAAALHESESAAQHDRAKVESAQQRAMQVRGNLAQLETAQHLHASVNLQSP